jgi:hypothetical protein
MGKGRRLLRMEDKVLCIFVRGDRSEVFAGEEVDQIKELLKVSVIAIIAAIPFQPFQTKSQLSGRTAEPPSS